MTFSDKPILELLRNDVHLAHVLDRFGIGFDLYKLNLNDACAQKGTNARFVLDVYRAFEEPDYFPTEAFKQYPLRELLEYLIRTHVYYIQVKLPKLEQLVNVLVSNYGNTELLLFKLKDLFATFKKNSLAHIQTEESTLFPHILRLLNVAEGKDNPYHIYKTLEKYSLAQFTDEHHHVDSELDEISRRIRIYSSITHNKAQVDIILFELKQFQSDIDLHGRLEDEVLLPQAMQLEEEVKAKLLNLCVNN